MTTDDARHLAKDIGEKVERLLSKSYARLIIEKHENTVYVEETDKYKTMLK